MCRVYSLIIGMLIGWLLLLLCEGMAYTCHPIFLQRGVKRCGEKLIHEVYMGNNQDGLKHHRAVTMNIHVW